MGAPITKEKTAGQVVTTRGATFIQKPPTYATYRQMAKHPTIAVARALAAVPVLAAEWSVESDDDVPEEWVTLIQDEVLNKRHQYIEAAVYGRIDYGYAAFEKVFSTSDTAVGVNKIKPLAQEITELIVSEDTGALQGLKQSNFKGDVVLNMNEAMIISFNVRGTNWYGEALLENCREAWNNWMEANEGAKRYDSKVAGGHIIVKCPQGQTRYNGADMDNQDIAAIILAALQSAGSVVIPTSKQDNGLGELEDQWEIVFDDSGAGMQPQFRDRLEYFDKLMARGMLLPERALQEGSHGTLAEAESHGDVALLISELGGKTIMRDINEQLVDPLLVLNYGLAAAGKVRVISSPMASKQRTFLETLYTTFLANPTGFMEESEQIDTDTLKDILGVPKAQEVAQAGTVVDEGPDTSGPLAATVRRVYSEVT